MMNYIQYIMFTVEKEIPMNWEINEPSTKETKRKTTGKVVAMNFKN